MDNDNGKEKLMEQCVPSSSSKRKHKPDGQVGEPQQRTPIKRQRVPVQKYQSPAEELIPIPSTSKQKEQLELLHKKGSFLGVRGEEGAFYLCKTIQNVFINTRKFKIQWLDLDQPPDVYKLDFVDTTDAECILTNVRMERVARDTYRLPVKEQSRVEEILHKALKKERGEPVDDIVITVPSDVEDLVGDDDADVLEEEDKDWTDDEHVSKRMKVKPKARKTLSISPKGKTAKPKQSKSGKDKKDKLTSGDKLKTEKKKGPDKNLNPNPKIKVQEKDPFFETKEPVEFVSKMAHGKLAIRAVLLNDMKLLKSLIEDKEHVYMLDGMQSIDIRKNALHYALEKNNVEAIKLLVKDFFCENERVKNGTPQSVVIKASHRGSYNPISLGIGSLRQVSQGRGNQQGNDAFVMDVNEEMHTYEDYVEDALKLGLNKDTFEAFLTADPNRDFWDRAISNVYQVVLCGNRKLAGHLIEHALKDDACTGFGYLHKEVLLSDTEELKQTILAASVRKKPFDNRSITALHCAAINPNVAYLTRLLAIEPNINIEDRDHRRPIHFAAVCEGIGPLEFLLQKGANPMETDNRGMTPLHYACSAGRPRNVDILLKQAKEVALKLADMFQHKWGPGGVDKPSRSSYCPVHIAVSYNHADVLKILIKHQVNVNKVLSANKNKLSPLIIAAGHGSLEICKVLVQNGAYVEQLDKLKRSALTHAVMNGSTSVASYLLHLGADPDRSDNSGNTVVHYAAAYGWLSALKLLQDAGADLGKANLWKTTPVGIAFLKGHIGIVDYLLKQSGVDINFKNDEGLTLVSVAASSELVPGLYDQIKYLVSNNGNPCIRDVNGMDALHHLAKNVTTIQQWLAEERIEKKVLDDSKMEMTVKIAKLLLDAGCDPTSETEEGKTALMLAVEQLNVRLIELLVANGGTVTSHKSAGGKTILHQMASLCMEADLGSILKMLVEQKPKPKEKPTIQKCKNINTNKVCTTMANGDIVEMDERPEAMELDELVTNAGDQKQDRKADIKAGDRPKGNHSKDGEINGLEKEATLPPRLQKTTSIASQEDIWPIMASEVDHEGYTPLLWACKVYRDFKTVKEIKCSSRNGRKFIGDLIKLTGADVSAVVKEKVFAEEIPELEEHRYTMDGKCSPLHLLVRVGHEEVEDLHCAGLQLVCQHKPFTEHKNLAGLTPLILALEARSVLAMTVLIKAGACVNATYGSELMGFSTALHMAADIGNVHLITALVDAGANVKAVNTKTGETPLHVATQCRIDEVTVIEVCKLLLAAGAYINAGTRTPLHGAVLSNQGISNVSTELEEFLISRGANVFARDEQGRLPLHCVFISKANPDEVSHLDPIELCEVLTEAMQNKELDAKDENGRTPLHMAAMRGATICCVHLLQRGVSLYSTGKDGHTALSLAVKNGHDSCAIVLLQKGAQVDCNIVIPSSAASAVDGQKYHTLSDGHKKQIWTWIPSCPKEAVGRDEVFDIYQVAISKQLQGVAHMVLDSTRNKGKAVESALRVNKYHIALRHLHHIKEQSLIKDYKNKDGQNLLHVLALYTLPGVEVALQVKVAHVLVEKGVSLMAVDNYKRYPMFYVALQHQQLQLAKFFLEKCPNMNLNHCDIYDRTVMAALFWNPGKIHDNVLAERKDFVKLLLDAGASLDVNYMSCLPATPLFDITITNAVLDFFTPLPHTDRTTPLITAMYSQEFNLIKFLLKNGASPNQADNNGLTPIMHAARLNDADIVRLLLNYDFERKIAAVKVAEELTKSYRGIFAIKPNTLNKETSVEVNEVEKDNEDTINNEEQDEEEDQDSKDELADDDEDDSEHDTEVAEDDDMDPDVEHLPIPRLGSKQPSLRRQQTSLHAIEQYEIVEKTSPVSLEMKDHSGWTVIHHVVSPLDYGSFDNEEILYILAKAGASLTIENSNGLTPLEMALKLGAANIARRIQKLTGVEQEKQDKLSLPPFHTHSESDSKLSAATANTYEADADCMLKKLIPNNCTDEKQSEVKPQVDKQCTAADCGEIVIDSELKVLYNVILSKIELRRLLNDTYNFYKMQIVWHKVKDIYILFTKWGRIGDEGMNQQTPFHILSEAREAFCKIFKSKTGNSWSNLKSFVNQPKKYRLVDTDTQPLKQVKVDFKLESSIPSKLPEDVQDLLTEIANVGMLQASMTNAKMAAEFMPFGRIKKDVLIEARKILQQIGDKILHIQKQKAAMTYDQNEHQDNCEQIAKLSTEYYSLIPLYGYTYSHIHPIVQISAVRENMKLISNLIDMEVASKILLGAQYRINEMNPLDYIYDAIGCSIQPLREDDVESQYILKYIRSSTHYEADSSYRPQVLCVYRLWRYREDEKDKFIKLNNHRLLWHGSNMSNFIGILHNGLLVAPAEAPVTGHAFGEGIYTADTFVKCSNYCKNHNPKSGVHLALLCEVALGNCREDTDNNTDVDLVNSEYNSLKIHGQIVPNSDWDLKLPYGAVMPIGCVEKNTRRCWMRYNEYIVQDADQVCLRYLVQFV